MDNLIPIYIGVPTGGPTTIQDSVDKARALGMKVDRIDTEAGAIHGSGPPGLVDQLRKQGLTASPVKKLSFGV